MELSNRLQAVADLVTPGLSLADVGCDHGYLSIYLTENKICPKVIAMDINEGPLLSAQKHILEQTKMLPIELRLSDGLKALQPKEVESITIAGMGGGLVIKILEQSLEIVNLLNECILQPQSEICKVRAFLLQKGFSMIEENMVLEDGKYYPMMKVKPSMKKNNENKWKTCELRYGKILLEKKNPILFQYLQKEYKIKKKVYQNLQKMEGIHIDHRKKELQEELQDIKEAFVYFNGGESIC